MVGAAVVAADVVAVVAVAVGGGDVVTDVVAVVADAVGGGDIVADVVADAPSLKLHLSEQKHFHISFLLKFSY